MQQPLRFAADLPHVPLHEVNFAGRLYPAFRFDLLLDQLLFFVQISEDPRRLVLELLDLLNDLIILDEVLVRFGIIQLRALIRLFRVLIRLV